MTVSTYKCIKCSTVFDSEDKKVIACKACGSNSVKWVRQVVTSKAEAKQEPEKREPEKKEPEKKEQEPNVNRGTRRFN